MDTRESPTLTEKIFAALDAVELRVGTVFEAELVPKSELLKMNVDFGEAIGKRTILGRIAKKFTPEDVLGKQFLFVTNLPARNMKGIDSEGMIFAAKDGDNLALLTTTVAVANGTRIG